MSVSSVEHGRGEDRGSLKWHPMEESFNSFLNVTSLNPSDPLSFFEAKNSPKENPCPFYDGLSKGCWKGRHCRQEHVKLTGPIISQKYPKLGIRRDRERVSHEYSLMKRKVASHGSIFKAVVTYVESPDSFYVIPLYDFECICTQLINPDRMQSMTGSPHQTGFKNFQTLSEELKIAMQSTSNLRTRNDYAEMETVAVKLKSPGEDDWLRGVITEDVYLNDALDLKELGSPIAKVFLFDIGKFIHISTKDICPLPLKYFSTSPPFGARCKIHGIAPDSGTWSEDSIKMFKGLVHDPGPGGISKLMKQKEEEIMRRAVNLHVKSSSSTNNTTIPTSIPPYSVYVYSPSCLLYKDRCVFVAEELMTAGFAKSVVEHPGNFTTSFVYQDLLFSNE